MLTARERLARQKSRPALLELHRALSRLTSTLTVMNTGAHPDDEHSGMLAAMRFGYGMRVVIACSTRGEGGQNSLGPERSGALGVLRTREMEGAARELDADIAWLGHGPADPVHDFGFSKNGTDTLARWGKDRTIERLVIAYRSYRPDIVIPTFLDVPGQHGHHRAMTEAAETALALAADPAYLTPGLTPWSVAKYYLPAWSGGGDTYDDEVPPPNASVHVTAPGDDIPTGASFSGIGEWSRAYHASQGMGRWHAKPTTSWALHLKRDPDGAENDIRGALPATLGELAEHFAPASAQALRSAQTQIDAAMAAYPKADAVMTALIAAATAIESAIVDAPAHHIHRLHRKLTEIDAALLAAAGIDAIAWADPAVVAPGAAATLNIFLGNTTLPVDAKPVGNVDLDFDTATPDNGTLRFPFRVSPSADLSSLYPPHWSNLGGNGELAVTVSATIGGRAVRSMIDLEEPLIIGPAHAVEITPSAIILPAGHPTAPIAIAATTSGDPGSVSLKTPPGWTVRAAASGPTISPLSPLAPGLYELPVVVAGQQAHRRTEIAYPHIGRTPYFAPEALRVLALDLTLPPNARIGYVGGGSDRVGHWLSAVGLDVTELDASDLSGDLSTYTSIVVGVFAFGLRPDLAAATGKLHDWIRAGGHLLTLYHRPSDGWNPDTTPPRHLVIGSPSLRWRVTNPAAEVSVLLPDHPLLTGPNIIGPADWAGWNKERGLYFAAEWDPAYEALLAMHDADEQALRGALISARIGAGRHTHTSLVLHHQLDHLVSGAFRLLANLVQPA